MLRIRNRKAAALGLAAALILALGVIILAAVSLITLLGGGQQMQRAADAGNLSLARSVLVKVSVPVSLAGDAAQFSGVSDHTNGGNGVINLRNINRVMGQAFLVTLNANKISQDGLDAGAVSHAQQISTQAQKLGDALAQELSKPSSVHDFFSVLAKLNPTKQFGEDDLAPQGSPKFSYMDRTGPSNVYMTAQQVPDYVFPDQGSKLFNDKISGWVTTVSSHPNAQYLKGYVEGMTPAPTFASTYFVPLKPGTKPHLVGQMPFEQNNDPANGANSFKWQKPVPNSLSIAGKAKSKQGFLGDFTAYALVEPIDDQGFAAAIPRGFIRLQNGAASPATGVAGGVQDAFVYTMNNPQYYPTDKSGKPLPYFVGANDKPLPYGANTPQDYINAIQNDINNGKQPDCSGFSVGFALAGDSIGLGGVSPSNCMNLQNSGSMSGPVNNTVLDDAGSKANADMHLYDNSDNRMLWARPLIERAYNIPPPTPIGSNGASVNVADSINLQLLSDRAKGGEFYPETYQSGIAHVPTGGRGALSSPNFRITTDQGVWLKSQSQEGFAVGGTMWNFLTQRMFQIDPNWLSYVPDSYKDPGGDPKKHRYLDYVLEQDYVPMGGRAYMYYSTNARGGKGGLVLKNEQAALADAPWLKDFIGQAPDAKTPSSPTETTTFVLHNSSDNMGGGQINVPGDWGYPNPYDFYGKICIMNWFAFTPSTGWNNLLGQLNMGATNTNCCPEGNNPATSFTINYGVGGDKINVPNQCDCRKSGTGTCDYTGPC